VSTPGRPREPSLEELESEAARRRDRLALYRRRIYVGRGEERRLAELERELKGAEERLRGARGRAAAQADGASDGARSGQPGS
jgi:hypothetical protein